MIKKTLEIPIYESQHYRYVRESDFPEGFLRLELKEFMKDKLQPLIQGEGRGVPAITDAIFFDDYRLFLDYLIGKNIKF